MKEDDILLFSISSGAKASAAMTVHSTRAGPGLLPRPYTYDQGWSRASPHDLPLAKCQPSKRAMVEGI
eukprot:6000467-Pyramimonas_sp.AAC.1